MKQNVTQIMFVVLTAILTAATGQAGVLYQINGATGSKAESINSGWDIKDKGNNNRTIYHNNDRRGQSVKPSFFYTDAYGGSGRSLKLWIKKASENKANASEKTEYTFVTQGSAYGFPVAKIAGSANYYTGFAMRLGDKNGAKFDSIYNRLMFYQIWQGRGNTDPGFNPPMAMQLVPGISGTQKLQIWVKNTSHTPNNPSSRITFKPSGSNGWAVAKGGWYKFIITARLAWPNDDASKNGYLKVWRIAPNGIQATLLNKGNYNWGYKPKAYGGPGNVNTRGTSAFNVYRAKQKKEHMICYDNVKHATTKSQATP